MKRGIRHKEKPVMVMISPNDLSNIFKSCWRLHFARFRRPKDTKTAKMIREEKVSYMKEFRIDTKFKKLSAIGSKRNTNYSGNRITKGRKYDASHRFFLDAITYNPEARVLYTDLCQAYRIWSTHLPEELRIADKALGKYLDHNKIETYSLYIANGNTSENIRILKGIEINMRFIELLNEKIAQ